MKMKFNDLELLMKTTENKQKKSFRIKETTQLSFEIIQLSLNDMAKTKGLFPGFYEIYKSDL